MRAKHTQEAGLVGEREQGAPWRGGQGGRPWGTQGRVQMPFVFLFQSRKISLFQEFSGNTLSFLGVFNDPSNRSRCSCESQLPGHSSFLLGVVEISLSLNCLGKSLVTFTCEWQPGKQTTASSHRLDHVDTAPGALGHHGI